jgi:hypothetical protein
VAVTTTTTAVTTTHLFVAAPLGGSIKETLAGGAGRAVGHALKSNVFVLAHPAVVGEVPFFLGGVYTPRREGEFKLEENKEDEEVHEEEEERKIQKKDVIF